MNLISINLESTEALFFIGKIFLSGLISGLIISSIWNYFKEQRKRKKESGLNDD